MEIRTAEQVVKNGRGPFLGETVAQELHDPGQSVDRPGDLGRVASVGERCGGEQGERRLREVEKLRNNSDQESHPGFL